MRFAEDLEDVFPHIPFPADHELFQKAAQIGAQIREIQTFDAARLPARLADPAFVRLVTAPTHGAGLVLKEPDVACLTLCDDGSGQVEGLPPVIWEHEVSGYPLLSRWCAGRDGQTVDLGLFEEFRDVCARVMEHVDLVAQADTILSSTLVATLNREALGLPAE